MASAPAAPCAPLCTEDVRTEAVVGCDVSEKHYTEAGKDGAEVAEEAEEAQELADGVLAAVRVRRSATPRVRRLLPGETSDAAHAFSSGGEVRQ